MQKRTFWLELIANAWKRRSIIWLTGVRRSGKTVLCKSIPEVKYFDCELPSVRRELEDVESFLESHQDEKLVLDEIHRLDRPAELLKIASDHFSGIKIIATGSSTLGASSKFSDTLTGRKQEIYLSPMISVDTRDFGNDDLAHRCLLGGLPPFFLSKKVEEQDFIEWIDSYWSKDIQELFRIERRSSFTKFMELLFVASGGVFEASAFSAPCAVSHTTIANYLRILAETHVCHVIRPFSSRKNYEIISAPKVYGFDTGFVSLLRGWKELRRTDLGQLWEHLVLNELLGRLQLRKVQYWRSKQGQEVDFILPSSSKSLVAIEAKLKASEFDPKHLLRFRELYPEGVNFVVAADVKQTFVKKYAGVKVEFVNLESLRI